MSYSNLCGWKPDYNLIAAYCGGLGAYQDFYDGAKNLKGSGAGKIALLYKFYQQIADPELRSHLQAIGDCVSHGWGLGVDVLACTEIVAGEREKWVAPAATEIIYALSRVEIGGGSIGRGDGSMGAWAADAVSKYGVLHRIPYLEGKYDFSTYDGNVARALGMPRAGCPDALEPIAKEHPVRTVSPVKSYEEARDAIVNGYPVPVCSNYGFREQRDSEGFARPSGRWDHCMLLAAADDEYRRPGLLCWNSWGDTWISGPKRHEQPDGSFWIDAEVVDAMLRQNDSFAISGYEGFKSQDLDYNLFA